MTSTIWNCEVCRRCSSPPISSSTQRSPSRRRSVSLTWRASSRRTRSRTAPTTRWSPTPTTAFDAILAAITAPVTLSSGPGSANGGSARAVMASATARTRRALSTCRFSIIRPSTVTTPRPSATASSNAAITRSAYSTSDCRRRPHVVGRFDLARMDQRLAVETHLHALTALGLEALGVLHVVVHAVEDDLACLAGGEQRRGEVRHERVAARHERRAQLLGEVVGAHHEHRDPRVGGDLADVEHRRRRLDHRPDAHRVGCTGGVELCRHLVRRSRPSRPSGSRPPQDRRGRRRRCRRRPTRCRGRCTGSSALGCRRGRTAPRRPPWPVRRAWRPERRRPRGRR